MMNEFNGLMMDDIPAWRMGEFLRIALQFLWDKPKGASSREILAHIPSGTQLTEIEKKPYSSSPTFLNFEILVEAALTSIARAGWLTRERFKWCLTNEGRLACQDFRSAQEFYIETQRIFQKWQLDHSKAMIVLEEAEEKAWDQIQQYLLRLSHHEFRQLMKFLLEAMEYHIIWVAPPEKERGHIDVIASLDPLGMRETRLVIQIKHKGQPLTEDDMEAALLALGNRDKGLVISTSGFTQNAIEFVRLQYAHEIALMDLERFFDLWVEHYEKLTPPAHLRLPLKIVYFLSDSG